MNHPILLNAENRPWEYIEGEEGRTDVIRWKTLLGAADSATAGITFGICEVPPGALLDAHHHDQPEAYYVLKGTTRVLVGDIRENLVPSSVLYIPPDMVHGIRNIGAETVQLMWLFPVDRWQEVNYNMKPEIKV